jgi:uncharacterized protein
MEISFDPAKSERNMADRGLPFTLVENMEWSDAVIKEDVREDYGERRYLAFGMISGRLHAVAFTPPRRQGTCHQFAQGEPTRGERL